MAPLEWTYIGTGVLARGKKLIITDYLDETPVYTLTP